MFVIECEAPDEASGGQPICRSNAFGGRVYGQFGCDDHDPWTGRSCSVNYRIQSMFTSRLVVQLRYSKHSRTGTPIAFHLDDAARPRAVVMPVDQGNWNAFADTAAVDLGLIEPGVHTLTLRTAGQRFGVADIDRIVCWCEPRE